MPLLYFTFITRSVSRYLYSALRPYIYIPAGKSLGEIPWGTESFGILFAWAHSAGVGNYPTKKTVFPTLKGLTRSPIPVL